MVLFPSSSLRLENCTEKVAGVNQHECTE